MSFIGIERRHWREDRSFASQCASLSQQPITQPILDLQAVDAVEFVYIGGHKGGTSRTGVSNYQQIFAANQPASSL
jgi:hypothetical protein